MPFEVVSGKKKSVTPANREENFLERTARQSSAIATRGLEGLIGAPQDIYSGVAGLANQGLGYLTGNQTVLPSQLPILPSSQSIRENFTNRYIAPNLPEGYLEPQGMYENIVHGVAGDPTIPVKAALTGGSSIPFDIARSGGQQVGIQAAQSLGGGPLSQFFAGALGGLGVDLKLAGKTPGGLPKLAKKQLTKDYEVAKNVSVKLKAPAPKTVNILESIEETLGSRARTAENSEINRVVRNSLSKVDNNGNINVKSLWDLKKELNAYIEDNPKSYKTPFYKQAVNQVNQDLADISKQHPQFGVPYQRAEDLYKAVNLRSNVGQLIENNTGLKNLFKNSVTKGLLAVGLGSTFGLAPTAKGAAAAFGLGFPARYAARISDFFIGHPHAQKLMTDALKEALAENPQAFANIMKNIKSEFDQYDKKNGAKKDRFIQIS